VSRVSQRGQLTFWYILLGAVRAGAPEGGHLFGAVGAGPREPRGGAIEPSPRAGRGQGRAKEREAQLRPSRSSPPSTQISLDPRPSVLGLSRPPLPSLHFSSFRPAQPRPLTAPHSFSPAPPPKTSVPPAMAPSRVQLALALALSSSAALGQLAAKDFSYTSLVRAFDCCHSSFSADPV